MPTPGQHQLAHRAQQRLQKRHIGGAVTTGLVRQADHRDQAVAHGERNAQETRHVRVARSQPTRSGIVGRVVGDHRLTGEHGVAEQGLEVAELHARIDLRVVQAPRGFVPGDVGDGVGLEVGLLAHVVQHFAHKTVTTARHAQQRSQQAFERLPLVIGLDERRLCLLHGF
ncbi:hypothetical protein D9M68_729370 [compost metagenome]